MKRIAIVALIAFLAVAAHFADAQDCTDELCTSTVGVTQDFASPDCSGNSTVSVSSFRNYTERCSVERGPSSNITTLRQCSAKTGFSITADYFSSSCSKNSKSVLQAETVGVCLQTAASTSQIVWCNKASISTKFRAAKLASNATTFGPVNACNMTTGCTNGTGTMWIYDAANCAAENLTQVAAASFLAGGSLLTDTCYIGSMSQKRSISDLDLGALSTSELGAFLFRQMRKDSMQGAAATDIDQSKRNFYTTCRDGYYTLSTSTGGCGESSNKLSTVAIPLDNCYPLFTDTWFKITCPSAASTLTAGSLVFVLLFALLLVF